MYGLLQYRQHILWQSYPVATDTESILLIAKPSPSNNQRKPHLKRKDSSTNGGTTKRTVSRSLQRGVRGIGRIQRPRWEQPANGWKK
jgi:hypothetical protein